MSAFFCDDCNVNMIFDHTDYYDFDIYKCPKCGREFVFPADGYGEPDNLDYHDEDGGNYIWPNKIGYQHLPEIECPYCKKPTIYTDDGIDEEGFPIGDIYCVECNRIFWR